jgi:hypothetical protein
MGVTVRSLREPLSAALVPFTDLTCQVHVAHESFQDGSHDVSLSCSVSGATFQKGSPVMFYSLGLPSKSVCSRKLEDSAVPSSTNVDDTGKCRLTDRIFDEIQHRNDESTSDSDAVVELTIAQGQVNTFAGTLDIFDHSAATVSSRKVAKVFPVSFPPGNSTTLSDTGVDTYSADGEHHHRRLAPSRGFLRVAVFRISAWDSVPTFPRTTQYANIFSGAGSLANQLSLCSNSQLMLTPCAPKAMEITVPMYARGADRLAVVNAAYPIAVQRIRASEPRLYGSLAQLEDYADVLIFMVVSAPFFDRFRSVYVTAC